MHLACTIICDIQYLSFRSCDVVSRGIPAANRRWHCPLTDSNWISMATMPRWDFVKMKKNIWEWIIAKLWLAKNISVSIKIIWNTFSENTVAKHLFLCGLWGGLSHSGMCRNAIHSRLIGTTPGPVTLEIQFMSEGGQFPVWLYEQDYLESINPRDSKAITE